MKNSFLLAITVISFAILPLSEAYSQNKEIQYQKRVPLNAPEYVCYKTPTPITVDGVISANEWDAIPWMSDFADIMGDKGPKPYRQTKVKMAHDDQGVYIAAWLEEPHVWATITQHDVAIYQDNAFEIFFNPTNDTHHYLEYEVNALGTIWDLYLSKPYRDNPVTFSDWEFMGMQSAVHIDGTLNNPNDTDNGWSIEVFIPWRSLYQVVSGKRKPADGDQIRANFMRVQWPLEVKDGQYVKRAKKENERLIESYWLWAPIGTMSIHIPEYWGYVQFTDKTAGSSSVPFVKNPEEDIKWVLRNLYYRQAEYAKAFGQYASSISELKPEEVCPPELIKKLTLHTTPTMYEIILPVSGKEWHIRQDGLVWSK